MKTIRETEHTKVTLRDTHYEVIGQKEPIEFAWIEPQEGPIEENGVNGVQIEDLLAICIHKTENEELSNDLVQAIYHLNLAKKYLSDGHNPVFASDRNTEHGPDCICPSCLRSPIHVNRTEDRKNRGVEGTNKK